MSSEKSPDISAVTLETLGIHLLFGDVDTSTMKDAISFIIKANAVSDDDITLMINTLGGSVNDGFALIDIMEASRLDIRTVSMGNIMSMGTLIMSAGTKGKRVILKNSAVMTHQFSSYSIGKYHELVAVQKSFEYTRLQMVNHFLRTTKMNEKQINDVILGKTDRYLSPSECKKFGLIDHIVDELPELKVDFASKNLRTLKP